MGGDGIPAERFQILKDDAVKVLQSLRHQIWKAQQWPQDWKRSVFNLIPKKGNAKECSNYHAIALTSQASKVMLKMLQVKASTVGEPRTSRCTSWVYKRQRNQRSNCQHPLDHRKSKRIPEKHFLLLHWLHYSLWLCGSQQTGKFLEMEIPDHLTCLLRNLYTGQEATVRTRHGTTNWFQIGKSSSRLCIVTLLV